MRVRSRSMAVRSRSLAVSLTGFSSGIGRRSGQPLRPGSRSPDTSWSPVGARVATMRVLLAGWFSFDEVIATVGDELGADVVAGWLTDLGVDHDVAWAPYLERGVDWRDVDPAGYTHLVLVSGPLADRPLLRELAEAFAGAQRWAVNVSVVQESARGLVGRVGGGGADRKGVVVG